MNTHGRVDAIGWTADESEIIFCVLGRGEPASRWVLDEGLGGEDSDRFVSSGPVQAQTETSRLD